MTRMHYGDEYSRRNGERGNSLVELVVVMVIIAIVTTLAVIQYAAPRRQYSRQNVSRSLKVALERARFDSVKRRAEAASARAKVIVNTTSFTLAIDKDKNGSIQSADEVATSFAGQNITITGSGMVFPVTLTYDQRGEVTAVDATSTAVNPVFRICLGNCSTPTNSNSDLVVVTPTGTVNLLGGAASPPSFAAPPVTAIGTGDNVNPLLTVP